MIASFFRSIGAAEILRAATLGLGLAVAGFPVPGKAVDIPLTFEFRPSALNPQWNTFVNTTPNEGVCETAPLTCAKMFQSVLLRFELDYGEFVVGANERNQAFIKIPNQLQEIQLRHEETGEVATASWRATLLAASYVLPEDVRVIVGEEANENPLLGHYLLWGSSWVNAEAPCTGTGMGSLNPMHYTWGWIFPTDASRCVKTTRYPIASMKMINLSLAYSMETPSPLAMKNGTYTGQLRFNVGPGQAFDFGDNASATDTQVTFDITLTVAHDFQVTFPSAAPRVTLAPIGGWQQWTEYGKPPGRLQQELPFTLSSSSDFSVTMRCAHDSGGRCGIKDLAASTIVPVDVDITVPGMSELGTGARAVDFPLVAEQAGTAPRFRPDGYMANRPSKLRFSANGAAVTQMLQSPGSRWQGDVTIVFDSDP